MSPHRLYYLDMRPAPADKPRRPLSVGTLLCLALLMFFAGLYAVHLVVTLTIATAPAPAAAPMVAPYSQSVEDARIEGFRAGFDAALEQGCRPATFGPLLDPI